MIKSWSISTLAEKRWLVLQNLICTFLYLSGVLMVPDQQLSVPAGLAADLAASQDYQRLILPLARHRQAA